MTFVPFHVLKPHPLLKDWLPALDPDELRALKEDVAENGVLTPLLVVTDGAQYDVVDGHHRLQVAEALGLESVPVHVLEGLDEDAQLERGLLANTARRNLSREQKRQVVSQVLQRSPAWSDRRIARLAGVSHPTVAAVRTHLEETGALESFTIRQAAGGRTYPARRNGGFPIEDPHDVPSLESTKSQLHDLIREGRRYGTILCDPPWQYTKQSWRAGAGKHYPSLTLDEIKSLPVRELASEAAHLHLWTTNAFLLESHRVLEHWGFEFKGSFVWCKPDLGVGNFYRTGHEFLLLGVRGGAPFRDRGQRSWEEWPRPARHSEKPAEAVEMIEKLSPGPRIELFSRQERQGWTTWGSDFPVTHGAKSSTTIGAPTLRAT
jgi:N6-adenosine-specific RNA methylase IME4